MGRTCGEPDEIKKHTHPKKIAALFHVMSSLHGWPQAIEPMQIDTWNRDGSMAKPGMPFNPGPFPASAQGPRSGPDAVYSSLLECPCTDRITRTLSNAGGCRARVAGTCAVAVADAESCRAAVGTLAQAVRAPPPTCSFAEHPGTFLGGYAPGRGAGAPFATLAQAQAWCCAHAADGCAGVTLQQGNYTARAGGTPTKNPLKGLTSWVFAGATPAVNFTTGSTNALPAGCTMSVRSGARAVQGYFNTRAASPATCGGKFGERKVAGSSTALVGGVSLAVAMDEAANKVTITLGGPADDVWFGAGFNADAMAALPYTIVVWVVSRSIAPQWGSILFRPLICTHAPWGCIVRVDELAKSRKIPTPNMFTGCSFARPGGRGWCGERAGAGQPRPGQGAPAHHQGPLLHRR